LIWAGRSETTNPRSVSHLGDSVIRRVMKQLHREGLVAMATCDSACSHALAVGR
jgi:ribosomal protein S19E (S16A)